MWIGNIKVKEKITETLIFFCQVLMIFFFFEHESDHEYLLKSNEYEYL